LVNPTFQRLTEPFEPLGVSIPKGDYNYVRHQIFTSSDPSKIANVIVDHSWGTYFDGKLSSTDIKLQFAPIPHISVVGRYNRNSFKGVGTGADKVNVDLYSIEGRFALNPRVQLIGFYQQNYTCGMCNKTKSNVFANCIEKTMINIEEGKITREMLEEM
jgi:hypothetical protein